jgi:hypothetical protein
MSLKLNKVETFKARVHVTLLTGDADRTQEASFVAEFKHLDGAQFQELRSRGLTDALFLDEVLVGVSEVADGNGAAMTFEAAREAIRSDLNYCGATVKTYIETLAGVAGKNSNRSRGL